MLTGGLEQACEVDLLSPFYGWGMQGTQRLRICPGLGSKK